MTVHAPQRVGGRTADADRRNRGAAFAGVILLVGGVFGVLQGASALGHSTPYANLLTYTYRFSITSWGWIHLAIGVALIIVGACVLFDMVWARFAGIALAAVSMAMQFIFLPYYPAWALTAIALDIAVLWALLMYASNPDNQHPDN